MEIILLERVENLGQMGDVVTVKNGYARNFLLPRHKALRATDANRVQFDSRRKDIEARNLEQRKEAETVAARMQRITCTLIRQAGEAGQLYGSVSIRDIADSLNEQGYSVDRHQVRLNRPIKALGLYEVRIMLHPEVAVAVSVNVARSDEEAERQAAPEETETEAFFESEELALQALEEIEGAEEAEEPTGETAETETGEDEDKA